MIAIDITLGLVAVAVAASTFRMVKGPDDADRAVAADLFFFSFIALVVLFGVRSGSTAVFDLALVATLVGFLSALSLARLLTRGKR